MEPQRRRLLELHDIELCGGLTMPVSACNCCGGGGSASCCDIYGCSYDIGTANFSGNTHVTGEWIANGHTLTFAANIVKDIENCGTTGDTLEFAQQNDGSRSQTPVTFLDAITMELDGVNYTAGYFIFDLNIQRGSATEWTINAQFLFNLGGSTYLFVPLNGTTNPFNATGPCDSMAQVVWGPGQWAGDTTLTYTTSLQIEVTDNEGCE